jgi:cellulose synthase operon protein C
MKIPPRAFHHLLLARKPLAALSLACLVALGGCQRGGPEESLDRGQAALTSGDVQAAVVHFKAFVQARPDDMRGRAALGRALLADDDAVGAAIELERAWTNGADDADVPALLARAWRATGRHQDVVERLAAVEPSDRQAAGRLKVEVAAAHTALGNLEPARQALALGLQADPGNTEGRLMAARLTAAAGGLDQALNEVQDILAGDPKSAAGHLLKGEILLFGRGDAAAASAAFAEAVSADPRFLPGYRALIDMALRRNDAAELQALVARMVSGLPGHPETRFAQAQLALLKSDVPAALEHTTELLRLAPDNARVLFLAGVAQLRNNGLLVAESHLVKAVQIDPSAAEPRRVLAQLQVQGGEPGKALDNLAPLLAPGSLDAEALRIAGQAELKRGRLPEAERFFRRSASASPENRAALTSLALTQIAKGEIAQGYAQLERLAGRDEGIDADLTLIASLIARGELSQARVAVDRMEAKAGESPIGHSLRGRILMAQSRPDDARQAFERSLALDANFYPAVAGLVELDVAQRRLGDALPRIEAYHRAVPGNHVGLLLLVQLRQVMGLPARESRALLEEAVRARPGDVAPRVLLTDFLLQQRDAAGARQTAQEAVAAIPDRPELHDALGRVLVQVGDPRQAITAFRRVVALQPNAAAAHLRLGDAQLRAGDRFAGLQSLQRARQLDPDLTEALQALVTHHIGERRFDDALSLARAEQQRTPRLPLGHLLEADVHLNQGRLPEALQAMTQAFERQRTSALATRLHALQLAAGRTGEADRFAADWLRANTRDHEFINHMGSVALQRGDFPTAEQHYRRSLGLQAEDVIALNNLAWSLAQQRKPAEALPFARKAIALAPEQPQIMNTLATALRLAGEVPEAIEWQRKSVAASNGEPRYRMQLAEMLVALGQQAEAREQLRELAALGDNFPQRDRVQELLRSTR